jgi:hypothetical protein
MVYRPAPGSSLSKEKAQIVGEALEKMGSFTPSDVVEAARPATSVLHEHFTWDDLKAAEKYRLVEARHLVNTITVVVKIGDHDVETRGFHSITMQGSEDGAVEQRYTAIKIVSAQSEMREQVIERAKRELEGWSARYAQYQDVFGRNLFEEIQRVTQPRRVRRSEMAPTTS